MIPVNSPWLGARERACLLEAFDSGWISSAGSFLDRFESSWAGVCSRRHGVAVTNGTAALHAAFAALRLEPGAEVILPTFTIASCLTALLENKLTPVFVDADPETWGPSPSEIAAKITPRTRAVLAVHLYGHPADMDPILEAAAAHGAAVVEDAAEVHGAEYFTRRTPEPSWRPCGSFGIMSAFSFYANKIITTGEGGMVLCDNDEIAERLRGIRNLCFGKDDRFLHEEFGFNFRLTNLQAAIGVAQIENLAERLAKKRRVARAYRERLGDLPSIVFQATREWARPVDWMVGIVLADDLPLDARAFGVRLRERGIESRPFFRGMHEQPAFLRTGIDAGGPYPVAERLARRGLYLPSGLGLTDDEIDRTADAVRAVVAGA